METRPGKEEEVPPLVEEPQAVYAGADASRAGAWDAPQTVERVLAGLPMVEFTALAKMLGLGLEELATHLSMSRSTFVRRRRAGRLEAGESDRLMRFARLFHRAKEVLDGEEAARIWLRSPARALEFQTPLHFSRTEAGAREVENLLGRIEDGVFS